MERFYLADVQRLRASGNAPYHEFLHVPSMSAGVYELGVGNEDKQQPHTEDELYFVVSGRATILVGEENMPVEAGSMVYVPARVIHRFHTDHRGVDHPGFLRASGIHLSRYANTGSLKTH